MSTQVSDSDSVIIVGAKLREVMMLHCNLDYNFRVSSTSDLKYCMQLVNRVRDSCYKKPLHIIIAPTISKESNHSAQLTLARKFLEIEHTPNVKVIVVPQNISACQTILRHQLFDSRLRVVEPSPVTIEVVHSLNEIIHAGLVGATL